MKPEYYIPSNPKKINQEWGVFRPQVYSQFGFTCHNGIDWAPAHDKLFRWPWSVPGKVVRVGNQPTGGGIFVGIITTEPYEFPDGIKCYILTDALHAEKVLVNEGDIVQTGDPIIIQDSTGFSTGPHTHEQDRRVLSNLVNVDKNDANNSFDPLPYACADYAETAWQARQAISKTQALINRVLEWLKGRKNL